ncbi:MAG: hypothetical protein GC151_09720 [Betaproteobacteria bacterium]|nr:hypothetical protein [Betaproteobacteria bacterium]
MRADFIQMCGWGDAQRVFDDFRARDRMLDAALARSELVVLWFEHDLYDQLQLVQILSRVAARAPRAPVDLICIGEHPDVPDFKGLSQLSEASLVALLPSSERVTARQLAVAAEAWIALCEPDPRALGGLARREEASLRYLGPALARLLQEYPSAMNGLSVTEYRTVGLLAQESVDPVTLFTRVQAREAAPFMGDWSFWRIVAGLCSGQHRLVQVAGGAEFLYPPKHSELGTFGRQRLELTGDGADVLEGRADAVRLNGIDRWIGGVRLTIDNDWRRHADGRLERSARH